MSQPRLIVESTPHMARKNMLVADYGQIFGASSRWAGAALFTCSCYCRLS